VKPVDARVLNDLVILSQSFLSSTVTAIAGLSKGEEMQDAAMVARIAA